MEFHSFISACLRKEPSARISSSQLLNHPLLAAHGGFDITTWLCSALAKLPPRDSDAGGASWLDHESVQPLGTTQPLGGDRMDYDLPMGDA